MYKGLWKYLNKIISRDSIVSAYLAIEIIGWMLAVSFIGMAVSFLFHVELADGISNSICAGIYAGIIFGLFGGILFLQRNQE